MGGPLPRSRRHAAGKRGQKKKKNGCSPGERPAGAAISHAGRDEAAVSREGYGGRREASSDQHHTEDAESVWWERKKLGSRDVGMCVWAHFLTQ